MLDNRNSDQYIDHRQILYPEYNYEGFGNIFLGLFDFCVKRENLRHLFWHNCDVSGDISTEIAGNML